MLEDDGTLRRVHPAGIDQPRVEAGLSGQGRLEEGDRSDNLLLAPCPGREKLHEPPVAR